MRILIASDCHLPIPAVLGGAIPSLMDTIILENEREQRLNIDVLSVFNEKAETQSEDLRQTSITYLKHSLIEKILDYCIQCVLEIIMPSRKGRNLELFWKKKVLRRLKSMLKSNDYGAVIIENQGFLTRVFLDHALFQKYQGKIYYHLHNDIPNSVIDVVGSSGQLILISNYLSKRIVDKYGEDAKKHISILKNGIPIQNYNKSMDKVERFNMRAALGFSESNHVICFVGRICEEKGVLVLLEAFLKITDPSVRLLIVGATEFGNNITSKFEKRVYDICDELADRVKMTGYISHDDIWKYFQLSDVAVLPSMWEEPAGLTVLEAMASGVPVITTDAGGIPEYLGNEHGVIVKRDNNIVEYIVEAINCVIRNPDDWKEKAQNDAKFIIQNYSENGFYRGFCSILRNKNTHGETGE